MSSKTPLPTPERTAIGGSLEIPRMVSGLWQLAGGHDDHVDFEVATEAMDSLISAGLGCFDMADHYGDAELIIGEHHKRSKLNINAFTKWCPAENGINSFKNAEKAVDLALSRMGQKEIDLMQYHAWDYTDDTYIHNLDHLQTLQKQGKIKHIGLTNTDAAHLELLIDSGFTIATNQVSCSVIDRRAVRGRLSSACTQHGVKILAYGTLLGGYLSEKWLGEPEPKDLEALNWSLRKYLRFIKAAGGWAAYQGVLEALSVVAKEHNTPIAAVATRYVLDLPAVGAVIVGSRLSKESDKYTASNLAAFGFKLTDENLALIAKAQESLVDIPGDCGDEYRRVPYLTATGDLSHHLEKSEQDIKIEKTVSEGTRIEFSSGSKWEPIAGYCRAVRIGNTIRVSGTTANSPIASTPALGGKSARSQTVAVLDIIAHAIKRLGGSLSDVVRTRIMIQNPEDCEEVSRAHGWAFECVGVRPANTLIVAGLIGSEYLVEIEVEAEIGSGKVLRI
ncbi:related to hormone-sensitive lipase [Phialocephala subalpina]|uniref:Related to hormone-sensitive lipase n=1 Tax=Phialocephala subalpina TaxID=576137 RepID=A0A1L7WFY9_9HELO|nr:related to hormone-sensitive lipase [Phialocephala subalpina]